MRDKRVRAVHPERSRRVLVYPELRRAARRKKRIYMGPIGGVLIAALALAMAAAPRPDGAEPQATLPRAAPEMADKTAGEFFDNIQVLQDTPAYQLLPLMRLINLSLGVSCEHCHDAEDRSLDIEDAKETARSMMTMVMDLNNNSFAGQPTMTCYSCHRGALAPVAQAILPGPDDEIVTEERPPAATSYPTADQILAKYVEALGGEQALRAVTSRVITATGDLPAELRNEPRVTARIEHYQKAPSFDLTVTRLPAGIVSTGFDGQAAWLQDAQGAVTQLTGVELGRARRDADFYQSVNLQQAYMRFVIGGIEQVNNRDAYVVIGLPRGDAPERLYFDVQTGLLLRRQTVLPTPLGNSPMNVDYEQYRDVGDGTKYPFLIRTTSTTQRHIVRIERVQNNAPIENSRFARPASRP